MRAYDRAARRDGLIHTRSAVHPKSQPQGSDSPSRLPSISFLGPSQLALGRNQLKLLVWRWADPRTPELWRVVWAHIGIGLCPRRMAPDGLPRRRGEPSLGPCPVCEVLDPLWRIPERNRRPIERDALRELRAKQRWLFDVVHLWGGGRRHVDEGTHVFLCPDDVGAEIESVVRRARQDLASLDLECEKWETGEMFEGRPICRVGRFAAMRPVELDLSGPRFRPHDLGSIFKPRSERALAARLREHRLGAALLGSGEVPQAPDPRGEPPIADPRSGSAAPAGGFVERRGEPNHWRSSHGR